LEENNHYDKIDDKHARSSSPAWIRRTIPDILDQERTKKETSLSMEKYLIIQLARFGDILQSKRLISGLSTQPPAEVHLAVDASLVSLAKLIYPDTHVHGLPVHGTHPDPVHLLRHCGTIFKQWQETDFSRVFNLNHSGFNHVLAGLFDPEQVAGYQWRKGQILRGAWPDMVFRLTRHRLTNPLNLMDYWGHFLNPALAPELVNPPARPKGGGVGVAMAGRHARRCLPVPVLVQILTAALHGHPGPIHLLGTETERPAARQLLKALPPVLQTRVCDLTGRTGWRGLIEVVSQLDLLLSPDTGTMHLAAHLGTPVTAFFLSSAWCFETGPYGDGHLVWQAARPCAPCLESQPCDQDTACLRPFTHKAVLSFLASQTSFPDPPAELCLLESSVDEFGLRFTPQLGELPESQERDALRELLSGHCLGKEPRNAAAQRAPAAWMYDEPHWMLEQS